MGLQNQLSDVSSESILIVFVVLVGKSIRYLQAFLFSILHALGIFTHRFDPDHPNFEDTLYGVVGSRLAGIILLCEQLNHNQVCSYPNRSDEEDDRFGSDCVVCLNQLNEGDLVRKLACRHVFHKDCFDGWLEFDHLIFSCPLCRAQQVDDEHVETTQQRVARDLFEWFRFQ